RRRDRGAAVAREDRGGVRPRGRQVERVAEVAEVLDVDVVRAAVTSAGCPVRVDGRDAHRVRRGDRGDRRAAGGAGALRRGHDDPVIGDRLDLVLQGRGDAHLERQVDAGTGREADAAPGDLAAAGRATL